jgi:hypothetical protein
MLSKWRLHFENSTALDTEEYLTNLIILAVGWPSKSVFEVILDKGEASRTHRHEENVRPDSTKSLHPTGPVK